MRQIKKGSTDRSIDLYIIDSTDGTPELGVLWNTAGIDLKYRREGSAAVSITEATLAALTTDHTDGGFLEIGNGSYRFDLPDAAWATAADKVTAFGTVTGMIILPVEIQLVDFDPEDSASLGLTAITEARLAELDAGNLPSDIDDILAQQQYGAYYGMVWIDETNGSPGTVTDVNGTDRNPVDNWADALTLIAALGLRKFFCPIASPVVSITLAASLVGFEFEAPNGDLAFGGQNVQGTILKGCNLSGTYVGHPHAYDCEVGAITGGSGHFHNCGLAGAIVATAASGGWFFDGCSEVAATSFDYGAANIVLRMKHLAVTIELKNMDSSHQSGFEGTGQITLAATCTGGTIWVKGAFEIIDNAGGAVTIIYDDNSAGIDTILSRLIGTILSGNHNAQGGDSYLGATAHGNLVNQYDGDGISGDNFPAKQSQIDGIANVGSASHKQITGEVLATPATTTGGSFTDIEQLNGVYMYWDAVSGGFEAEFTTNIGSGTPGRVNINGYLQGNNDAIRVQMWDYQAGTPGWKTIGPWEGGNLSNNKEVPFTAFIGYVGIGANKGDIRIRLYNDNGTDDVALTAANIYIDQMSLEFSPSASSTLDRIYLDSNASNTNTVPGQDGVPGNPVSTLVAVNTLLAATGLHRVEVAPDSTATLAAGQSNQVWSGENWILELEAQNIAGSAFIGADVSGIAGGTGTKQTFRKCHMNAVTLIKGTHVLECGIGGTQTAGEAGDYHYDRCHSSIAGVATWIFDFSTVDDTNLNWRNGSGGIQLENMGNVGTDTASIEGRGQIIEGTCTGGIVAVRGLFTISGITNLTLVDDARYAVSQSNASLLQRTTIATLASQIDFTITDGSIDDGAYGDNGAHMAICVITDSLTSTQKCMGTISDYTGATKTIALVRDPGVFTISVGDKIDIFSGATSSSNADEKYTGATHNVADSNARRQRNLQEFGDYERDSVWIDTVNGSPGITDYESGTINNKVDSMTDANVVGTSLNKTGRAIISGSSIILAASQDNQNLWGHNWTLALGIQSISGTLIQGADVSGVCSAASPYEFHECNIANVTVPPGKFRECEMGGTLTMPVGIVHLHTCVGEAGFIIDYGVAVANSTIHASAFAGDITIDNLGQNGTDILYIRGWGKITFNASCVGGTVYWDGHFTMINNGSGISFNGDDITTNVDVLVALTEAGGDGDLAANLTATNGIQTDLDNSTDGLGALKLLIDAVKAETVLIVGDTNELQLNQGNWLTAIGFSTHSASEVWAVATRTLTAGDNIILAKGVGVTGFNDLSAAQVNAECDTANTDYGALRGGVAMTEGYAADGAEATPEQMLYMLWSSLSEFSISGTVITAKKLDGTTTSMSFTLDDATDPTSRTRLA